MAYYLASDGVDDYIQLNAPVEIPVNTPYRIEIDFQAIDGADFGVRLSGNIGGNANRTIVWKGATPNTQGPVAAIATTGSVNILNRAKWAWYRPDAINNRLSVDDVVMPAVVQNSGNASFSVLLTELSATNSRNPVNLYSYKVFVNDVLIHHWDPSASNGVGNLLLDVVGGNHGTLVNFPGNNSQWVYYFNPAVDVNAPHIKCITNGKYYPNLTAIGSDALNSNANTGTPLEFEVSGRHVGAFGFPSFYNSVNPSYLIFRAAAGQAFDGKNGDTCAAIIRNDASGLYSSATSKSRLRLEGLRIEAATVQYLIALNPDRNGQIVEMDQCLLVGAGSGVENYGVFAVSNSTTEKSSVQLTKSVITNFGAASVTADPAKASVTVTNCLAINNGRAGQSSRGGVSNSQVVKTLSVLSGAAANVFALQAGSTQVATGDATGTDANLRNLTVTGHVVDWPNGDYRIKTTSHLHALNIGAFFEPAGVPQNEAHTGDALLGLLAGFAVSGIASERQHAAGGALLLVPAVALSGGAVSQGQHVSSGALLTSPATVIAGGSVTQRQYTTNGALLAVPAALMAGGSVLQRQYVTGSALLAIPAVLMSGAVVAQRDSVNSGALLAIPALTIAGGAVAQRQHVTSGDLLAVPAVAIAGGEVSQSKHVTGEGLLSVPVVPIANGVVNQGDNHVSGALLSIGAGFVTSGTVAQVERFISDSLITVPADFVASGISQYNPDITGGALLHVACDFIVDGQYNQQYNYQGGGILECNARFIADGKFHQPIKKLRHSGHRVWNEQARRDQIEYVRQHPDNFTALLYLPVEQSGSGPANDGWLDEPLFGRADANQQKTGYADPKVCWVFERPREDAPFVVDSDGGDLINEHDGYLTICAEMDLPVGAALEFEDELSEGGTRRSWWYVHHITSLGTTKAGAVYYLIPLRDFTGLNV